MVKLEAIKENEKKQAFKMHRKGFVPTFFKYYDRINPIFESYKKFCSFYNYPNTYMFWIMLDTKPVGEIWINIKDDTNRLARLFVLKKFQNSGIAQQAIKSAENLFFKNKRWRVDTIKEEKNNCHLYEKAGYRQIGNERKINKRMTIINYEKRIK